jgi:hypothetical protein
VRVAGSGRLDGHGVRAPQLGAVDEVAHQHGERITQDEAALVGSEAHRQVVTAVTVDVTELGTVARSRTASGRDRRLVAEPEAIDHDVGGRDVLVTVEHHADDALRRDVVVDRLPIDVEIDGVHDRLDRHGHFVGVGFDVVGDGGRRTTSSRSLSS